MTDFYSQLDAIVTGNGAKRGKLHVRRSAAKEELDNNSSQEEFMNAVATAVAAFIKDNRNAFDLDDTAAISEFAKVMQLEEIQSRVLSSLQEPEEDEDLSLDNETTEDSTADDDIQLDDETSSDNGGENDLVSEDVMAMLDEDK